MSEGSLFGASRFPLSWSDANGVAELSAFPKGGRKSNPATILPPATPFSQRAEPAPLWFATYPKSRTGRGTRQMSRAGCGTAKRGCASRVPLPRAWAAWRTGGVLVEGAPPPFAALVRHRRGVSGHPRWHPLPPPFRGGRSLHSDPCGKAWMKTWSQVILINLALAAVGLPYPCESRCFPDAKT